MKKRIFRWLTSVLIPIVMLSGCGETSTSVGVAEAGTNAFSQTAAGIPVKEDYSPAPAWDGSTPTHENGPWAQSYAVFDALSTAAEGLKTVDPERTFTLACHDPVDSGPGELAAAWANAVAVATSGRVRVNVGYSGVLSSAMTSLDDMKLGTIDFDWTLPCYFNGYMPLTNVIQNPGLGIKNGTAGSWAMWELYKSSPELQAEYADDGVLLFVCANCTSPLSYKGSKEISSIAEIRGNIRANNGPAQIFVEEAGATVFGCPIGDVYNNVQHGIINYLITDWNGIDSFSLSDPGVLNYYIDSNVGCSAFALMANADIWDSIGAELQEAILSVSGDYMLNLVDIWSYWEACGRYNAVANGGTVYTPSDTFSTELSQAYANVASKWVAEQADREAAQRLYDLAETLVERYNTEFAW